MTGHDDREWFGREPARPDETAYLEEQQERHRPEPNLKIVTILAADWDALRQALEVAEARVAELEALPPERLLAMALTKEQLVRLEDYLEEYEYDSEFHKSVRAALSYLEGENASRSQEQRR